MKTLGAVAVVCVAAIVASTIYTAWLNVAEQKRVRKMQPLLGVAYSNQRK